ncbi:MAG TPA: DUF5666 domain-containing protein, partial [Candidatus Acidoferrales bacterium]|nr:DUF5666 domain-containing protein [Candidatus Acidoferrales bacterium]
MRRLILFLSFASSCLLLLPCVPGIAAQDAPSGQPPPQGQGPGGGGRGGRFRGNGVFGRIQSISPTEIKLAAQDGSTVTVHINSKTVFRIDQQDAKIADFKVGATVFVRGTKNGDAWDAEAVSARNGPSPAAQGVMGKDFVAGTVKAIDGTKITILRLDNVTQTIELDENTSLSRRRESITLADVHPGDAVSVRGETKDGAFVPRSVNLMDAAQLERMKQFMNGGGGPAPGAGTPPPPPAEKKPDPDTKPPQELP